MHIQKKLKDTFNLIRLLKDNIKFNISAQTVKNEDLELEGQLVRDNNEYKLEVFMPLNLSSEVYDLKNVVLKNKDLLLHTDKFFINSYTSTTYTLRAHPNQYYSKAIGSIINFSNYKFNSLENNNKFRRLVIPTNESVSFAYYVKTKIFDYENDSWSNSLVDINFKNKKFHFYFYSNFHNKENYLIIDSLDEISNNEFYEYTYSMILSFGFITGKLPYGEGYYFLAENEDFQNISIDGYKVLQESISSVYSILLGNSYGYRLITGMDKAHEFKDQLKEIDQTMFSNICNKIYDNNEILRSVSLFLLAHNYEIYSACTTYNVVLETISNEVLKLNEGSLKPIKDEKIWRTFRDEIVKIFDEKVRNSLSEVNAKIIFKKLENLNSPTNTDKLLLAFSILDIKLSEEEIKTIKSRNIFLHGKHPALVGQSGEINSDIFGKTYYFTLRLIVLISKLLMKYFGYNGKIVNYPKMFEHITKIKVDEEYYINV